MEKFSSPIEYKPNSPLDFDYCLQLVWNFAEKRLALVHNNLNNNDRSKMVAILQGEWREFLIEKKLSSWENPTFEFYSELADFCFGLFLYMYLFLPEDFNYGRAEQQVDPKIRITDQFLLKIENSIQQLAKPHEASKTYLFLIAAMKSLSFTLPKEKDFNAQLLHTTQKNGRNYRAEIFSGEHPWLGNLDSKGLQEQYDLGASGMKKLRAKVKSVLDTGLPDGIPEEFVDPFIVQLRQIEQPKWALISLENHINIVAKSGFFQSNRNFQ